MDSPMWPELLPDIQREISRRLGDAGDFVNFHAVCKPWRDSHEPTRTTRKQWARPWLLAPAPGKKNIPLKLRCVFSRMTYRTLRPFSEDHPRNWVASADGTAVWYFVERPSPSLRDGLTGAFTLLPPFPHEDSQWEGSPSGIVYNDGTVLLWSISDHCELIKVKAALLRRGDVAWMVAERTFSSPDLNHLYVSYYNGKILITIDGPGPTVTPDDEASIGHTLAVSRPWMPRELDDYYIYEYIYKHSYMLESRGELLCVSIYISQDYPEAFGGTASVPGLVRALSMFVHALEEDESAPGKMRWVRKDGGCLANRVLFLGWPNSFAVDASRLSGDVVSGGCAYFVYHDVGVMPDQPCYMFRYNLLDDKAKFVERLPKGWRQPMYMWLFPQPSIAPSEEIIDRLEGRKWWKKRKPHIAPTLRSNIYIKIPQPQCYNTYFKLSVGNLPPEVDSFQLGQFFGKHGKVSSAKVVCKRKTQMSKKIGLLTIAMVEERADALAALNGLVFNGCTLEVRLVRWWKGRRAPPAGSNQHSRASLICIIVFLLFLFTLTVWWKLV